MLRTIIVLPDGTELSSGAGTKNAIKSITITECVNDAQELTLGSTCSNMIELAAITPDGGFSIAEGDEFTVYRENEDGIRHKVGLFTSEKPTRASAHSLKVTAYDRVSWLDKDLTDWLANLAAWPYTIFDLAKMACGQCGLEFANDSLPNGNYYVQRFSAEGITGRQLMRWIGQIVGRFCRATPEGLIEFAWYETLTSFEIGVSPKLLSGYSFKDGTLSIVDPEATVSVEGFTVKVDSPSIQIVGYDEETKCVRLEIPPPRKTIYYFQGGLNYQDYQIHPIEKVQIKSSEHDIGAVYPQDLLDEVNTYVISGNYLISSQESADLVGVAQTLYEQLKDVSYTPCKVAIPANTNIHAGHIIKITDKNGVSFNAYVMTSRTAGQKQTLECTGNRSRGRSAAVNEQTYQALSGKVFELQLGVEGMRAENREVAGKMSSLSLNVDGISAEVQGQQSQMEVLQQKVTKIDQKASGLEVSIQSIADNGVNRVETKTGFTFGEDGLSISRSDSDMENQINETGMYVRRRGENILQANDDGVEAVDVTVRNYLIVGNHARFEDYSNGSDSKRTACFWI